MAKYIRGIDVAHWEPEIDWMKLRAQEIRFAFIKATQAADYVDNKFLSHWTGAKQAGILRGAYHFIDPRVDGRLQAENFLRTVKLEPGDLPPVLDLEDLPATPTVIPKAAAGRKSGKDGNTGSRPGKGPATATRAANSQMIACAEVWLRAGGAGNGPQADYLFRPGFPEQPDDRCKRRHTRLGLQVHALACQLPEPPDR